MQILLDTDYHKQLSVAEDEFTLLKQKALEEHLSVRGYDYIKNRYSFPLEVSTPNGTQLVRFNYDPKSEQLTIGVDFDEEASLTEFFADNKDIGSPHDVFSRRRSALDAVSDTVGINKREPLFKAPDFSVKN